jgi:hypothetical protein
MDDPCFFSLFYYNLFPITCFPEPIVYQSVIFSSGIVTFWVRSKGCRVVP